MKSHAHRRPSAAVLLFKTPTPSVGYALAANQKERGRAGFAHRIN
jgi:hypothetical protein